MSTATVARTVGAIAHLHVCRQLKPGDAEMMFTKRKGEYAEMAFDLESKCLKDFGFSLQLRGKEQAIPSWSPFDHADVEQGGKRRACVWG
jgi:hypothetical protein